MPLDITSLLSLVRSEFTGTNDEWLTLKASAHLAVSAAGEETLYGDSDEIYEASMTASTKEPYGSVPYADEGYQKDGKKRYPIDNEGHIRAAWNYINKPHNAAKYSSEHLATIKRKIISAWKKHIDKDGPPSAKK